MIQIIMKFLTNFVGIDKIFSGVALAKVLENYERKIIGSWKQNQGKNYNFFEVR